ncbi:MAG: PAS domain S-box protein [Desulfobacterales bacterium]|nr:PAS domain S-box protein [Desulfobacterales bacterium]
MKNDSFDTEGGRKLRQKAERLLDQADADEELTGMPPKEIAKLVHELRVHQMELKMQNDELRRIQAELEKTRNRYVHLYDFAPTAYFTVDETGAVAAANLTAACILDRPRATLVGRTFSHFISGEDRDIWYLHRKRLLETGDFQSFQLRLVKNDGSVFYVHLECLRVQDGSSENKHIRIAVTDITGLKRAEDALRQLNETLEQQVAERTELAESRAGQLQTLAVNLIEAEERERQRIATLLHEDLQQILAAARFQVQAVHESMPRVTKLADVAQMLSRAIDKSRHLSYELSPSIIHYSGLVDTLRWLARQMRERFGLEVHITAEEFREIDSTPLKTFIFRVAQELLFNVVKHAGVQRAQVHLSAGSGHTLSITVSDEGRGFDPAILRSSAAAPGLGLLSLWERADYVGGSLVIDSAPGQGNRITLSVPTTLTRKMPI